MPMLCDVAACPAADYSSTKSSIMSTCILHQACQQLARIVPGMTGLLHLIKHTCRVQSYVRIGFRVVQGLMMRHMSCVP